MTFDSASTFLKSLREHGLIGDRQFDELSAAFEDSTPPLAIAESLRERGLLTPYQVSRLNEGKGRELVLDRYVLLRPLGEGGMGQVFKARHQKMDRVVALKVIKPDRLSSRHAVERFEREIRAVANLSHPNIIQAYDAGEEGETHYFVMEYVDGIDLGNLIKRDRRLPVAQACDYVRQAALGLQHAHERGMVHRDIKPSNLLLTHPDPSSNPHLSDSGAKPYPFGLIKVLDLGLALLRQPDGPEPTAMTNPEVVMGTPDYMSPEQAADAHKVDVRSDLYSLGCTLFHLLAGEPPYSGGSVMEKLIKHQVDPVPALASRRADVPPGVAAVVARLLAKNPAERFQKPIDLAQALAPFCREAGGPPEALPYTLDEGSAPPDGRTMGPFDRPRETMARGAAAVTPNQLAAVGGGSGSATPNVALLSGESRSQTERMSGPSEGTEQLPAGAVTDTVVRGDSLEDEAARRAPARPRKSLLVPFAFVAASLMTAAAVVVVLRGGLLGPAPDTRPNGHGGTPTVRTNENGKVAAAKPRMPPPFSVEAAPPVGPPKPRLPEPFVAEFTPPPLPDPFRKLYEVNAARRARDIFRKSVAFSANGRFAAFSVDNNDESKPPSYLLLVFDLTTIRADSNPLVTYTHYHRELPTPKPAAPSVTVADDGTYVLYASTNRQTRRDNQLVTELRNVVERWGIDSKAPVTYYGPVSDYIVRDQRYSNEITCVDLCAPKGLALAGSVNGKVLLFNLNKVGSPNSYSEQSAAGLPLDCVALSPDGTRALAGDRSGGLFLWDVSGDALRSVKELQAGSRSALRSVAFSPDGRRAATGGADNLVRLWDLEKAREIQGLLEGHAHAVTSLAFSRNGRYLVSGDGGDRSQTVRLWDVEARKELERVEPGARVLRVAFTPAGPDILIGTEFNIWAWRPRDYEKVFDPRR